MSGQRWPFHHVYKMTVPFGAPSHWDESPWPFMKIDENLWKNPPLNPDLKPNCVSIKLVRRATAATCLTNKREAYWTTWSTSTPTTRGRTFSSGTRFEKRSSSTVNMSASGLQDSQNAKLFKSVTIRNTLVGPTFCYLKCEDVIFTVTKYEGWVF